MIVAVLLSTAVATLALLMLTVGLHADKSTARGRHFSQALHVAESGIERAIERIEEAGAALPSTTFTGQTEVGTYEVTLTRQSRNRYVITSVGGVRQGRDLGATRKIRAELRPPLSFDSALFSYTTVETKNNDVIKGDVWGNHNVILAQGTRVEGSVIAATGYLRTGTGVTVDEDVTTGGFDVSTRTAVLAGGNSHIYGDVTAAVVLDECVGADNADYKVQLDGGTVVHGNVVTWGNLQGAGTVLGTTNSTTCRAAQPVEDLPPYSFAASNYGSVTYFGTPTTPSATAVTDFQTALSAAGNRIQGAYYINQAAPLTQSQRLNLTNTIITGDTTIVTNTPVFTNDTTDDPTVTDAIFALVSTYDPPSGTVCDVNQDNSECSIHLKNNFSVSGKTAVLVYAPYGPVAVKNNAEQFGAIYADSIQVKNNQTMTYDDRVARLVGFGEVTLEVTDWQELPAT